MKEEREEPHGDKMERKIKEVNEMIYQKKFFEVLVKQGASVEVCKLETSLGEIDCDKIPVLQGSPAIKYISELSKAGGQDFIKRYKLYVYQSLENCDPAGLNVTEKGIFMPEKDECKHYKECKSDEREKCPIYQAHKAGKLKK